MTPGNRQRPFASPAPGAIAIALAALAASVSAGVGALSVAIYCDLDHTGQGRLEAAICAPARDLGYPEFQLIPLILAPTAVVMAALFSRRRLRNHVFHAVWISAVVLGLGMLPATAMLSEVTV